MIECETCRSDALAFEMNTLEFWYYKMKDPPLDPQCRKTHRVKALKAAREIVVMLSEEDLD